MKKLPKCEYCNNPLNEHDSVFIRITRYDRFGRRVKRKAYCTTCWDHERIFFAYTDHDENLKDDPLRNEKLRIHYTPNKEAYNND